MYCIVNADIDCGKLTPPIYGTLHYSNDSTHLDSEVKYSCSNNYRLTGTAIRRCQENQAWSGTAPKCEGNYYFYHFVTFIKMK